MDTMIPTSDWHVEVFFDGDCPLCLREIKLLRWLDRKGRIRFTDIAAPDFQATDFGKTPADFMDDEMHLTKH
jgi:predicted DCC family thiol-disulfide oxidoreductase YuxK